MLIDHVTSDSVAQATGIHQEYCKAFLVAIKSLRRSASVSMARGSIKVTFAGSKHPTGGCDVRLSPGEFGLLLIAVSWRDKPLRVYETIAEPTVLDRVGLGTVSIYNLTGFLRRTMPYVG